MSYKHLNLTERYYIEVCKKEGYSMNKIALALGRAQSTISREINRNTGKKGYRHKQAECLVQQRHKDKRKAVKITEPIKLQIQKHLKQDWSPEQIAGRFKSEGVVNLHHESIYQYVLANKQDGGTLYKHLRHQNKTYRKRYGSAHNRTGIPNRVGIEQRPEVANNRQRVGDWEADTIIGKNHKGAIVTLDERKSKLRLAAPLQGKTAQAVHESMVALLYPIRQFVETITFDNGKEFTLHEATASALSCETYFANPYHSWERGQNENANGLLRQYFPKSMELLDVASNVVSDAVHKLNSRPRKCLRFKTPYEAFLEVTGLDVKSLLGYALNT